MIRLEKIDNIIEEIVGKRKQVEMRKDFFKFAKKIPVKSFNKKNPKKGESIKDKENRDKYNEYSKEEYIPIKEKFLDKIQKSGFYFCCYCGKDRITHFKEQDGKTKRLYDIEHFLPRSKFPDLSVNLYNWLPACMSCNQRIKKAENPLDKKEIFHPYFGFLKQDGSICEKKTLDEKYSFTQNDTENRSSIFGSEHSDFFKLSEIYLNSHDTFNVFNFIQDKRTKIKDEQMRFKKSSKTPEQLKDYFFKNYYPTKEEDILKYSNGKLKKDLIESLKIEKEKSK